MLSVLPIINKIIIVTSLREINGVIKRRIHILISFPKEGFFLRVEGG